MKKFLRGYLAGILTFVLLFTLGTAAFAGDTMKSIAVKIDKGVKVCLNGTLISVKDDKGKTASPLYYNGTYYLPVKAVANAGGLAYNYDARTKVMNMGILNEFVYVNAKMYKDFYGTMFTKEIAKTTFSAEKAFATAITNPEPLTFSDSFLGDVNLAGKYTKFYATVCLSSKAAGEQIIQFLNKDTEEALMTITLKPGETRDIEFSVSLVKMMRISGEANQGGADGIWIGNPRMK